MSTTFKEIQAVVKRIPRGRVATYGQIAQLAGIDNPRVVGWAMRAKHYFKIPCHRVIKQGGYLAQNFSAGGWDGQRKRLLKDGVTFLEKYRVDLEKHLWEPSGKLDLTQDVESM